jgi:hypothetical protein
MSPILVHPIPIARRPGRIAATIVEPEPQKRVQNDVPGVSEVSIGHHSAGAVWAYRENDPVYPMRPHPTMTAAIHRHRDAPCAISIVQTLRPADRPTVAAYYLA